MNSYSLEYIELCREDIRALRAESELLIARQKREPNPHKKSQLARDLSAVRSEITANYDDIRATEETIRNNQEVLIDMAYQR